jgi:hypothetical protein
MIRPDELRRDLANSRQKLYENSNLLTIPATWVWQARNHHFALIVTRSIFKMFARKTVLSLVFPFLLNQAFGEIQLDVNSQSMFSRVVIR